LNFDLIQIANVISDYDMRGIYFDLSSNNFYIVSWGGRTIYIYHTNDEVNFDKIHNITTSYNLEAITINNGKIYIGTGVGKILVYNKTNYDLIQVMENMCSSSVNSVKYDCQGNMIYSCSNPPMVKIIGSNGINTTVLLNDTFTGTRDTYIDSRNRLWIGGNNGAVVYN
jgi:ligand-binding sensor domain-containing protein